jgi:hypothetical protein
MDETIDPLGRTVQLAEERWQHIIDGHPYMTPFYLRGAGPSRWLKVVVAFDEDSVGSIRTAFPRRSKP